MLTLAIETATTTCSVAQFRGLEVVDARHIEVGRGHAERLLPMIAELTGGGRADRILVDCGPGSFTGVRVGIAAARALGFGWGATVAGYHSLALLVTGADMGCAEVAVAIEGGHGHLFVGRYATSPLAELAPPRSLAFDEAVAAIADDVVVGNAAGRVVAARGWGQAVDARLDAQAVRLLPPALTALVPSPFYGRDADAKPQVIKAAMS